MHSPEHIGSTAIDIPIKANAADPPASPSRPSVKSTPFPIETKQNEASIRYNFPSHTMPIGAGRGTNIFLHEERGERTSTKVP